jgi:hypothetical protein
LQKCRVEKKEKEFHFVDFIYFWSNLLRINWTKLLFSLQKKYLKFPIYWIIIIIIIIIIKNLHNRRSILHHCCSYDRKFENLKLSNSIFFK